MHLSLPGMRDLLSSGRAPSSARLLSRRQERQRRRLRARRIKAILAGGLVFGIGSAATVAAWTDSETAEGSFEAGTFDIEVSVNGSSWTSNPTMTFNAGDMFPGAKVYAKVFVKTTDETTMNGTVKVSGGGIANPGTGIGASLKYRAVTQSTTTGNIGSFGCGESTFAGSPSYVLGTANRIPLRTGVTASATQSVNKAATSVQAYCFEVMLPVATPNVAQGTSATHTWTWDAESVAE